MNAQKEETGIILDGIANAFCRIGEPGLAFAVRNMPEGKAAQLAEIFKQAGFDPKRQEAQQ